MSVKNTKNASVMSPIYDESDAESEPPAIKNNPELQQINFQLKKLSAQTSHT